RGFDGRRGAAEEQLLYSLLHRRVPDARPAPNGQAGVRARWPQGQARAGRRFLELGAGPPLVPGTKHGSPGSRMGHVRVTIRIAHPARREEPVEVPNALVDTGATWTTVPRQLADRLGLEVIEQLPAQTAAGVVTVVHSFAVLEYDGRRIFAAILITDRDSGH